MYPEKDIPVLHLCNDYLVVSKPPDLVINAELKSDYLIDDAKSVPANSGFSCDGDNGDGDPTRYIAANNIITDTKTDVATLSSTPPDDLASALRRLYPHLADASLPHHFRFVHRLDFSTSGVICLALNKLAASRAAKQFEKRRVTKTYLALLRGHLRDGNVMG